MESLLKSVIHLSEPAEPEMETEKPDEVITDIEIATMEGDIVTPGML